MVGYQDEYGGTGIRMNMADVIRMNMVGYQDEYGGRYQDEYGGLLG